jgi:hypothetical protein
MELQEAIQIVKQRYQTNTERINDENNVIKKYGSMFHPDNLDRLTAEKFKSFLLIRNNKHWEGIHRQGNMLTSDMGKEQKPFGGIQSPLARTQVVPIVQFSTKIPLF